jgi:hypothetical protein
MGLFRSTYQWMYRGGRPNGLAGFLNGLSAKIHALGIARNYLVTLEVQGRHSGKPFRLPLVMAVVEGERYLVSMLGKDAAWVLNVKAAGGHAKLLQGGVEDVRLVEVPVERRANILKVYLKRAPGARPHFPISKDAPLAEFERIAPAFPVFHVVLEGGAANPGKP